MPYPGLPPKDDADRVRRNAPTREKTFLDPDEDVVVRGMDLPEHPQIVWSERTVMWWEMWRRSPQAKLMTPTDWETMLEAAFIHNEIWRVHLHDRKLTPNGLAVLMGELTATGWDVWSHLEDRQKLSIVLRTPQVEEEQENRVKKDAKAAVDYATRLNQYAAEHSGDE